MRILSIDTTSPAGSVAVSLGEDLLAQEQQGVYGTHAERLLTSIEHLLTIAGWKPRDVEGVAVAIGPGSFTGLRIGIASAKAFAVALSIPIVGVSSLAALALNGRGFHGTVASLIDARRGELYLAAHRVELNGTLHAVISECVLAPGSVAQRLLEIPGDLLLVGDGAIAAREPLLHALGDRATIASGTMVRPQAVNLALLGQQRLKTGGDDAATLVPNYIRQSDAEIGFGGRS